MDDRPTNQRQTYMYANKYLGQILVTSLAREKPSDADVMC